MVVNVQSQHFFGPFAHLKIERLCMDTDIIDMSTMVVNVKVAHLRSGSPTYDNLKEWMADPQNVYVGRAGIVFIDGARFPKKPSKFANPFKISKGSNARADVLRAYRQWLLEQIASEDITMDELRALRGKTLGCWCKPESCHADILVEFANM
jgi:Domain of unknown function (DUF4326)